MYDKNARKGFTLLEVLTTIAIIGILSSVVMVSMNGARARGRDSKRIADISQMAIAMEVYYNACRKYPEALATTAHQGCSSGITLGSFLSTIPTDPGSTPYGYAVGSGGSSFALQATLETNDRALTDDVDGTVLGLNCGASPEVSGAYYFCKGS